VVQRSGLNKLAETCSQYLTKGQKVLRRGRLQTRSWEGNDGQKHSRVEVNRQPADYA